MNDDPLITARRFL